MRLRPVVAVSGLCALALLGVGAAAPLAAAASRGVTAVTHTSHHADTSTKSGACTTSSVGGPVWAYDNLSFRFRVVSTGTDTYTVTITASGSYDGFASRFTGACTTQRGSVHGWVNYQVTSTAAPDPSNLPPQEMGNVPQTTMLEQLFLTKATIKSSHGWRYTYTITGMRCVTSSTTTHFSCS